MCPPLSLPYVPPQLPDLGGPCPALRKQGVAGLSLSSPTPPTPVVIHLVDLVFEVGSNRRVAQQKLIISAGDVLGRPPEDPALDPPAWRGSVLPSGVSQALRDSLPRPTRSGLSGDPRHMGETGLPSQLTRDRAVWPLALDRCLGVLVGFLVFGTP